MSLLLTKRQFVAWLDVGIAILIYAVWSGRSASGTVAFFLCFVAFCGGNRGHEISRRWRQFAWPFIILLSGLAVMDLSLSRADDPWFSSTLHRTITGTLGTVLLCVGCMVRRAAIQRKDGVDPSAATPSQQA